MSQQTERVLERRRQLSALMDGDADAPSTAQLCAAWRDDAESRRTWYAWHLIGDVLRSDDLAPRGASDMRFVASLRARLGVEPVIVAPQSLAAPPRRSLRRLWGAGAAVAAGFAVVAGAMLVLNPSVPPSAGAPTLAARDAAPVALVGPVPVSTAPADPQVVAADGELIRDARLDRYLAAHKPLGRNPALATSSFGAPAQVDDAGRRR